MAAPSPFIPKSLTGPTGLSPTSIYADARAAGFSMKDAITATAIALVESGGDNNAHNPNPPDDSWGVWQINMIGGLGPARRAEFGLQSNDQLTDPMVNARVAYGLWKDAGGSFAPWTTYTDGAYQGQLATAQNAARIVGDSIGSYTVSGKGLGVLGNAVKGAAGDAAGAVTGAVSNAVSASTKAILGSVQPIAVKVLFIGLGATLLGVGVVKATGAHLPKVVPL